jgi:hypothetical protein
MHVSRTEVLRASGWAVRCARGDWPNVAESGLRVLLCLSTSRRATKGMQMTDLPITLDHRRGMMAQKATERRRLRVDVERNAKVLREQQDALEAQLAASPSATWPEAAAKAGYLLRLFSHASIALDPRRQRLIVNVLDDFARLTAELNGSHPPDRGEAFAMANKEQRGNREVRKKPKNKSLKTPTSQASPFSRVQGSAESQKAIGKKSR